MDKDNSLGISWHDSAWIPMLNPSNILDYFSQISNPFYDRTCNNELIKMQRLGIEQLNNMTGIEYILLHAQEPILYVVRKQERHSPTHATPLTDFYIIAGVVYQAPDLASVINSRLLNTLHNLQSAFDEASSYSRYHPSKGYWWEFKDHDDQEKKESKDKKKKEEQSSHFQRQRVDLLLNEISRKFPPKFIPPSQPTENKEEPAKPETVTVKQEIKQEKTEEKQNSVIKPPPEKKPKLMR